MRSDGAQIAGQPCGKLVRRPNLQRFILPTGISATDVKAVRLELVDMSWRDPLPEAAEHRAPGVYGDNLDLRSYADGERKTRCPSWPGTGALRRVARGLMSPSFGGARSRRAE